MATLLTVIIAIFIVYIFSFYKSIRLWLKFRKFGSKIPGPASHPILGNVTQLQGKNTHELIDVFVKTANECREKGANVMRFQLFDKMYVWPLNGETAAKILNSTTELQKGDNYRFLDPWIGGGLILVDGDQKWKSHRKLLTPTFHFAKLEGYFDIFNNEAKILVEVLENYADNGETFDMFPFLRRCTLDTICEAAMGKKLGAQQGADVQYGASIEKLTQLSAIYSFNPMLWSSTIWRMLGYKKEFDDNLHVLKTFTAEVLKERRAAYASGEVEKGTSKRMMNFLDLLLSMEESNEWTEDEISEEVDTFMFAGHDTTTASTSWLCWNLAHNPEIQEKCYQEIVGIFGEDLNSEVTLEGVNKLEYTERVIKESKRKSTPVPAVMRKLKEEMVIDGCTIPSEATVTIGPVVYHLNPQVFPNPEKFDPDRFLPEETAKRHAFDYVPFSAGLRSCIGQRFAQNNEKAIIVNILRSYKIVPTMEYYATKPCFEAVAKPSHGIPIKLIRRE